MAYDANSVLQSLTTITTTTTSTAVDLGGGTPRRGLKARFRITAISGTGTSITPKLQHSSDNTTFYDLVTGTAMTATGIDFLSFETSDRYVRLVCTTAGTAASIAYDAMIGLGRP